MLLKLLRVVVTSVVGKMTPSEQELASEFLQITIKAIAEGAVKVAASEIQKDS